MIGIYKIINNLNNKVYIGQSIDIEKRIYDHFKRNYKEIHGILDKEIRDIGADNFSWKVIKECNKEELNYYEQYYISLYKSTNPQFGYNLKGGGSPLQNSLRKQVINIDTEEIYESLSECAKILNIDQGDAARVCNHLQGQIGGYRLMYLEEYKEKGIITYNPILNNGKKKIVKCIETNQVFESAHEAGRQLNLNYRLISAVCNGKRKTTGGYHFVYL